MSAETAARWVATAAVSAAVAVLAIALGAQVAIAAALGLLSVAVPGAVVLWRRYLDDLSVRRDRSATLARQAPVGTPGVPQQGKY